MLTDTKIRGRLPDGRHTDGRGLILEVSGGSRRWILRVMYKGVRRDYALGNLASLTLADAREKAAEFRAEIKAGRDPVADAREAALPETVRWTFADAVESFLAKHVPNLSNEKHAAQWRTSLTVHCKPLLDMPVADITVRDVLATLKPIWTKTPESASRTRGRLESVLGHAAVLEHRTGDNPARWTKHLSEALPSPAILQAAKRAATGKGAHHAAMPYAEVPAFMARLLSVRGTSARALELIVLTACRSGEARLAVWSEFDLDAALWVIPAERMKAKREHRVALSTPALALLRKLEAVRDPESPFVFAGARGGKPLSVMAFDMVLRGLALECTTHGFRSSFRDWVSEETDFDTNLAEAALAHVTGDKTERAYRRGDALEKRRALMEAWAAYLQM